MGNVIITCEMFNFEPIPQAEASIASFACLSILYYVVEIHEEEIDKVSKRSTSRDFRIPPSRGA